ncbi:hypothetical protein HZA97_08820 [Candidatus Woesearchaeota archaeon]|nr:hypothetical protein [Candidatus Woesearchaeota archaeon]
MKALVFDTGPIISLATNNLLQLLPKLQEKFKGDFFITQGVHYEIIERPLKSRRFKFEALQVERRIEQGVLQVYNDKRITEKAKQILSQVNSCFKARGKYIQAVQLAEVETLVLAKEINADAVIIDELITRLLIENPEEIVKIMTHRLGEKVEVNKANLKQMQKQFKQIKVLRSAELVTIAFEMGILDKYLVNIPQARKELLEGLLWGVKLNGCAITEKEIDEILESIKK